jgi:chromosome segregation ATPase
MNRHPIRAVGPHAERPAHVAQPEQEPAPVEDAVQVIEEPGFEDELAAITPELGSVQESRLYRLLPTIAAVIVTSWTVFFIYAHWRYADGGLTAADVANFVRDWALPVVLVAVAWLLAMRSSAREAHRFGTVAGALEQQSRILEERLATVNRELGLAREFLSAETRELEFLGRGATERISETAETLQGLIRDNGAQVDAIASVSATALENMNRLRQDLPVVAASARDMTNQIANAGRSASEQIDRLSAEYERLRDAGHANEDQISRLEERTSEAIAAARGQVDDLASLAEQRLAELRENSDELRRTMSVHEEEALAAVKTRTTRLGSELSAYHARLAEQEDAHLARLEQRLQATREQVDELHRRINNEAEHADQAGQQRLEALRNSTGTLLAELEELERQADAESHRRLGAIKDSVGELDSVMTKREQRFAKGLVERKQSWQDAEEAALNRLGERMAALDADLSARREQEIAQTLMLTEHSEAVAQRLQAAAAEVDNVVARTRAAEEALSAQVAGFAHSLGDTRELIDEADAALNSAADAGARVLQLVQTGAQHARGDLLAALAAAAEQIEAMEGRRATVASSFADTGNRTQQLSDMLEATTEQSGRVASDIAAAAANIEVLNDSQSRQLNHLRQELAAFEEHYAATVRTLTASLSNVVEAARGELAATQLLHSDTQDELVVALATRVGQQSAAAIEAALEEGGVSVAEEMAEKMREAAETGRGAVVQLRDQLGRVHELTSNLEARIAHAREQAEENVDNDFSRRVALITERLNSTAIDLDKFLATEVSETAWTSYLKGDRGIFTRKAVRLLDNREAREIAELYNSDVEFRGHVNRYVHDFEAMLRSLLSTRNGNSLGVTILSSDMGKLYVALAQAIERLRQ